jgi:molybdate transport system substrate-binding protein
MLLWLALLGAAAIGGPSPQDPPPLRIAVAANFASAADALGQAFAARGGRRIVVASGATGLLYAQIVHGAPFDVLLAADTLRPARLERDGHAVPGSRRAFALGRLALWSRAASLADSAALFVDAPTRVALAKPETAPYGAAARQVLRRLGAWDALDRRLVRGENVSQVYQFVWSGSAAVGLVARSALRHAAPESYWLVPSRLHDPIVQEAVLLRHGEDDADARRFLDFLQSPEARAIIRRHGYDLPT